FQEAQQRFAKDAGVEIADVPRWRIRTPLQRAVQLLKRHRDVTFSDHLDDAPTSMIVTTLAGRAYGGETDIAAALLGLASGCQTTSRIETAAGGLKIPLTPMRTSLTSGPKSRTVGRICSSGFKRSTTSFRAPLGSCSSRAATVVSRRYSRRSVWSQQSTWSRRSRTPATPAVLSGQSGQCTSVKSRRRCFLASRKESVWGHSQTGEFQRTLAFDSTALPTPRSRSR